MAFTYLIKFLSGDREIELGASTFDAAQALVKFLENARVSDVTVWAQSSGRPRLIDVESRHLQIVG